jgi:hypothetical protein
MLLVIYFLQYTTFLFFTNAVAGFDIVTTASSVLLISYVKTNICYVLLLNKCDHSQ